MKNQCVVGVFPTAKNASPPDPEKLNPARKAIRNGAKSNLNKQHRKLYSAKEDWASTFESQLAVDMVSIHIAPPFADAKMIDHLIELADKIFHDADFEDNGDFEPDGDAEGFVGYGPQPSQYQHPIQSEPDPEIVAYEASFPKKPPPPKLFPPGVVVKRQCSLENLRMQMQTKMGNAS